MTLLILARHGNTFEAGQAAVWVGARTDLPLTSKGHEQAAHIGEALKCAGLIPTRTLTGPLRRTRQTAAIALGAAGAAIDQIEIDERLREIDYGAWEGKSSSEIAQAGGGDELDAWERESAWPRLAGWPSSREEYLRRLSGVLQDLWEKQSAPALVISSNGLFRLLAHALGGGTIAGKMGTGRMALLRLNSGTDAQILAWNLSPEEFPAFAAQRLS